MEPDTQEPQHNISYEEVIADHTSETRSIAPRSGQHIEVIGHDLRRKSFILCESSF
jgi:hypothetical protein